MRGLALLLVLIPAIVWAALPARDDFERATLGTNWSDSYLGLCGSCTISGGALVSDNAPDLSLCFWSADAVTVNDYACVKYQTAASALAGPFSGPCVAMGPADALCCQTSGTNGWRMERYQHNQDLGTVQSNMTPTFGTGDYMGIERLDQNDYQCFRSTNGTTWTAIGPSVPVQGDPPGMPNPGFVGVSNDGQGFAIELWEGGNGVLPTLTPCGLAGTTTTTTTTSTTSTTKTTTTTTSTLPPTTFTTTTTTTTILGTTSTTTSTTTTSSTTTSSTLPPPPGPPTAITHGIVDCTHVTFSWVNDTDPFAAQVCIGVNGCTDLATRHCIAVPGTTLTFGQTENSTKHYTGCTIDSFGQFSTTADFGILVTPPCLASPCGDVTGDGIVNSIDALAITQYAVGLQPCSVMRHPENCDVNHDGLCNLLDANLVSACAAHIGTCTFTCGPFSCATTTTTTVTTTTTTTTLLDPPGGIAGAVLDCTTIALEWFPPISPCTTSVCFQRGMSQLLGCVAVPNQVATFTVPQNTPMTYAAYAVCPGGAQSLLTNAITLATPTCPCDAGATTTTIPGPG